MIYGVDLIMRFVLKGYSHEISNEVILIIYKGLVSYDLNYVLIVENDLNSFQNRTRSKHRSN